MRIRMAAGLMVLASTLLTACPGQEPAGPGIQTSGYAAELTLEFRAGNGAVYVLSNVGDLDDSYTITISDERATVTPKAVDLIAGSTREVGIAGADPGSTITVVSVGSGAIVAKATTG